MIRHRTGFSPPAAIAAALLLTWMLSGCATSSEADAPDLGGAAIELQQWRVSVEETETSVHQRLDQLQQTGRDLEATTERLSDANIPLGLLRLVAMNCLNTEYEDEAIRRVDLDGTPLTCRAAHIERLRNDIADVPRVARETIHQLLYHVDQTRLLRGAIRSQLSQLDDTIEYARNFVADQRAMLRQRELELDQRHSQLTAEDRRRARELFDDHRQNLDELDELLDEVEQLRPRWSDRVDELVSRVYFALVDMRHRPSARLSP